MSKKIFFVFIFTVLSMNSIAGIILPDDNFVIGWTTTGKILRFTRSDLFNYINGGAELFLEFGFEELLVQGYKQGENEIVLEAYRMESPESALGIYLMKCGTETSIKGINAKNSGNKYQFNIVKGSYYLQINSFAGNEKLIPIMITLVQQTIKFIPEVAPVKLLEYLPKVNLIPGSELIIRGPYALQPIYTFGEGNILQLRGKVFGVIGDYKDTNFGRYTQLVIKYPNSQDALSAYTHLITNLDPYLEVTDMRENGFIFQDFQGKFGVVALTGDFIKIKIKLKRKP